MGITNTEDEYGILAKSFHWIIAVLILGLLPVGLFMGGMENAPVKFQIYAMHKSFGLLVFFLGLARIVWRFVSPPPEHLENHAHWEITLAGAAHFWLYVCIIGMPLSGWIMSSAGEFPVPFFGIQMPAIVGKDPKLGELFYEVHEVLGFTLLFVLALHMAGALKHHILDKDVTLQRMMTYRPGWLLPVIVIIVAGISYLASGAAILSGEEEESKTSVTATSQTAPAGSITGAQTASLPADGWAIDPAASKLQFQAMLYNAPFTATLGDFNGTIVFNPDNLDTAKADITILMNNINSGDGSRDENMKGPQWYDVPQMPQSWFVSKRFEKGDGNAYVAIGDVTIHGVTMPLIIPFQLNIKDKVAHMTAKFSLDRRNFAVGVGEWEDEKTVAHNVDVSIDLTARQ